MLQLLVWGDGEMEQPVDKWHVQRSTDSVVISRAGRAHWDVWVDRLIPGKAPKLRVAHQVRQDMWRALRRQRGFSPVVSVRWSHEGLAIRAGGAVAAPFCRKSLEIKISVVLDLPENRARWLQSARKGGHSSKARRGHAAPNEISEQAGEVAL